MSTEHKRIAEVTEILGRLAVFFPAWKPTKDETKVWVRKLLGIPYLDVPILKAVVEVFIEQRQSPYPPTFAEIRHEHERRIEDRARTQRKLSEPKGAWDADAARKANAFVSEITRAVKDVPEA